MDDRQDQLAAALADRYRVEREVGQGGMAVVYLAHDLRHDRKVAIKVLKPLLAATLGAERFVREIRTTASLRHPHIVPLYDSGAADGLLYYVMPFIEGESLRARLDRERQLPLEEALRLTREVAAALGHAHDAGVVHRDVKPENILLENGHAVVTDFGIARAIDAAGRTRITQSGLVIGTPAYMSPEQSMGEGEVDARSDVYALGSVLYEMLAGEPPYPGATPQAITAKRLMQPVPKVTVLREGIPPAVEGALLRALARSPADRFQTAAAFVAELEGNASPARPGPSRRTMLAVTGVAVLAVLAAVLWLRPAPAPRGGERPLIAVLPFRNAGAPEDEFFADGVTEEITSRLGGVSGIGVISRTTALRYKGTTEPLRAIGHELGVQYILAGTIRADRRADGSGEVRVTPELVRVSDETQVWTEGFTARLTPGEIFAIQMRIAEQVAVASGVRLLAGDRARLAQRETADPAAYDLYLRGRFLLNQRTPDLRQAIAAFEGAVTQDPGYAAAWAGLASAYATLPFSPVASMPPAEDILARADAAARRALALDSTLASAHVAKAQVLGVGRWRWPEAEAVLKRAIALDPGYGPAHEIYSEILRLNLRLDSALAEAGRAVTLEPTSGSSRAVRALALLALERYDEAETEQLRAISLAPESPYMHVVLAQVAGARGDLAGMARALARTPGRLIAPALAAYAADTARRTEVVRAIASMQSPNPGLDANRRGWWYATVGAPELAIAEFEKAVEYRAPSVLSGLRIPSVERALGSLPAYRELLARVGLPAR